MTDWWSQCCGNVFYVWVLLYLLQAVLSVVHPSGSAEPPKLCIKETDCATVHRSAWCFVHPHTCCSPKLTPHYLHHPTCKEQNILSTEALVAWYHVCKSICRAVFYFLFFNRSGRKGVKFISMYQPANPLLHPVQTPWRGDIVGHQVWCNRVSWESVLRLDTGLWCKRGVNLMEVTACWPELLLVLCTEDTNNSPNGTQTQQLLQQPTTAEMENVPVGNVRCEVRVNSSTMQQTCGMWRWGVCVHTHICQQDSHAPSVESSVLCKEHQSRVTRVTAVAGGRAETESKLGPMKCVATTWVHTMHIKKDFLINVLVEEE